MSATTVAAKASATMNAAVPARAGLPQRLRAAAMTAAPKSGGPGMRASTQ